MRAILLSAAVLVVLASPALAQETDEVSPIIVVTRLPSLAQDQPGVHIVTARDLEARQANTAYDALQTVPGLSIYRTGAFGGVTTIRQRGMTNDKSLVVVDGVPQNDASQPSGGFDFARLSMDGVSRIEVLNGPQGSLWGSDAIGGVIAITTRPTDGLRLRAEGGSFATYDGAISAGRVAETWSAGVFASSRRTGGISVADRIYGNRERDGDRNDIFGARGGLDLAGISLDGRVEYDRSRTDTDGYPPPTYVTLADTDDQVRTRGWNGFGRAKGHFAGLDQSLTLGAATLDRDYSGMGGVYGYKARNQIATYVGQYGSSDDALSASFGAERKQTHATLSSGVSDDLSTSSAFAIGRWKPAAPVTLTGSIRYDDPDRVKGKATGRLAASWDAGGGWRLLASAGQGFKTPSISQAVCDFCFAPAVPLRPETAQGYDLGAAWASSDGRFGFDLDAYQLRVKDQIAYVGLRYINIARVKSRGLEASAHAALGAGFALQLAYALTDAVDDSTGARLVRVPVTTASGVLFYAQGAWSGALTVRGESSQSDVDVNSAPTRRKGFVVADLAGAYTLNERVSFTARIENLGGRHYQEVAGYGEPGRAVYVGLRLRR